MTQNKKSLSGRFFERLVFLTHTSYWDVPLSFQGYPQVVSTPNVGVTGGPPEDNYENNLDSNRNSGRGSDHRTLGSWVTSRTRPRGTTHDNDLSCKRCFLHHGFIPWILGGKPIQKLVTSLFGFVVNPSPRPSPLRWGEGGFPFVIYTQGGLRCALLPWAIFFLPLQGYSLSCFPSHEPFAN